MSEPVKPQAQIILDQLVTWLTEIQIANGYYTDAGLDLHTEQSRDREPDAPCLYLFDDDATATPVGDTGKTKWTQSLTIEALIHDNGTGRAKARRLIADIRRALKRRLLDWPPAAGVSALRETARSIPPRPQNSDWLTPSVAIEIDFFDKEV